MLDPLRLARVHQATGQALRDPEAMLDLTQRQHPGIGGQPPTIEAGHYGLVADG